MQNGLSTVEHEGRKVFEIRDFNAINIAAPIRLAITAAKMGVEPQTEAHSAHPEAKIIKYPVWMAGWEGNMRVARMTAPELIEYLQNGRGEHSPADHKAVVAATV